MELIERTSVSFASTAELARVLADLTADFSVISVEPDDYGTMRDIGPRWYMQLEREVSAYNGN